MISRKLFSFAVAAFVVFTFSTSAFAEFFSVSAGIPVSYAFTDTTVEADGMPSGAVVHVKFPIMVGVGYESYVAKIKNTTDATDTKMTTNMFDVFYLFPIPVINFTLGLGAGTATIDCSIIGGGGTCADNFDPAQALQWWAQLGFPIFPFLDIHASYHSVTAIAKYNGSGSGEDADLSGTMMALGVSFIF
ncbi:hypothetical protein KKA14_05715 [bacterium]|nr:hypothetical protein [bacterium]